MADIEHGAVRSTDHPTSNRGVHPIEGFNAITNEAAREALAATNSSTDRGRVVYQTAGLYPGWYISDGTAGVDGFAQLVVAGRGDGILGPTESVPPLGGCISWDLSDNDDAIPFFKIVPEQKTSPLGPVFYGQSKSFANSTFGHEVHDAVVRLGFNVGIGGGSVDNDYGSIAIEFEGSYESSEDVLVQEMHLVGYNLASTSTVRFLSWQFNPAGNTGTGSISSGLIANQFVVYGLESDGTQRTLLDFSYPNVTLGFLSSNQGSYCQLNNGGTTRRLIGIGDDILGGAYDTITVGDSGTDTYFRGECRADQRWALALGLSIGSGTSYTMPTTDTGKLVVYGGGAGGEGTSAVLFRLSNSGKFERRGTVTAGGTTGAQTISRPCGTVNIAAGQSSIAITNSLVSSTSLARAWVRTNDATAQVKNVVCTANTITVNMVAAVTGETSIGFVVEDAV